MLRISELLLGSPLKLRYVNRFSTTKVLRYETVAEHSYFVAFYTMIIGEYLLQKQKDEGFHEGQQYTEMTHLLAIRKALVHDIEESVSGDFPRPFKYSNEKLRLLLEAVANQAVGVLVRSLFSPTMTGTDQRLCIALCMYWERSKDDTPSGRLVKFADFLSVLSYMIDEIKSGNKENLTKHIGTMKEYLALFSGKDYDFLREFVNEASIILQQEFKRG